MTLDQAYESLGLTPLDTFIQNRLAFNREGIIDPKDPDPRRGTMAYQFRGIGATTWMLVSAALRMAQEDVLIVAPDHQIERKLQDLLNDILANLGHATAWERRNSLTVLASQGHSAYFSTNKNSQGQVVGMVGGTRRIQARAYEDVLWKTRAIRRAEGPFSMVREIRLIDCSWESTAAPAKYHAFAEDDEFLFEMTREGALDLLKNNGDIRTRGWEPPKPKKFPVNLQPFPKTANVLSDPTGAKPGDLYYDSVVGKMKMMDENGNWLEVEGAK